jgi:hypothetical protein
MTRPIDRELYDALGLPDDATPEEVHAAYRKASLNAHPDRPEGSREKWALITLARDVLCDPKKRADYDRTGRAERPPPDNTPGRVLMAINRAVEVVLSICAEKNQEPAQIEFVDLLIVCLAKDQAASTKTLAAIAKMKKRVEKLIKRITRKKKGAPNVLVTVLDGNLRELGEAEDNAREELAALKEAIEALRDTSFEVEFVMPDAQWSGGFTTYVR